MIFTQTHPMTSLPPHTTVLNVDNGGPLTFLNVDNGPPMLPQPPLSPEEVRFVEDAWIRRRRAAQARRVAEILRVRAEQSAKQDTRAMAEIEIGGELLEPRERRSWLAICRRGRFKRQDGDVKIRFGRTGRLGPRLTL